MVNLLILMYKQIITNEPNLAEWLHGCGTIAVAAIALPGTIVAFISLFLKDANKEKQIVKLTTRPRRVSRRPAS